jgi:RND family efflux transporter MFP subunit
MKITPLYFLLLSFTFVLSACGLGTASEVAPTPLPTQVRPTAVVQRGEVAQELVMFGRFQPIEAQDLTFTTSGTLASVYVNPGDTVTTGQLLAVLDTVNRFQSELETVLEQAKDAVDEYSSTLRRAEMVAEIARLNIELARSRGALDEEIQLYELQYELAALDLQAARNTAFKAENLDTIARLEASIAAGHLYAPADGQIIGELIPGIQVRANGVVALVGDPTRLDLIVTPDENTVSQLKEGITVTVSLESPQGSIFTGVIRQLPFPYGSGVSSGGVRRVAITLSVDAQTGGYQAGDTARVTLVLSSNPDALWLPPEALRTVAGKKFVYIQGASGPQRVNVTTGIVNQERVEILEGLREGQSVILP